MRRFAFLLAFFLCIPCFTYAQVSISNPSFELGTDPFPEHITVYAPDFTTITDWFVSSGSVDYINGIWQAAQGDRSVDVCGDGPGVIEQPIATVAGHTYILTFSLAGNPEGLPTVKELQVSATGNPPQNYTFDVTGYDRQNMGWVDRTYTFTATAAFTTLAFTAITQTPYGPVIDYLRIREQFIGSVPAMNNFGTIIAMIILGFIAIVSMRKMIKSTKS